jgi:hypothetical protein
MGIKPRKPRFHKLALLVFLFPTTVLASGSASGSASGFGLRAARFTIFCVHGAGPGPLCLAKRCFVREGLG